MALTEFSLCMRRNTMLPCEGRRMKKKTTGFTLIELLVVIGVIAIVASILLPVLTHARSTADTAVCRSNVRQLMLGLSLYVQDAGAYPVWENGANLVDWFNLIEPNVGATITSPVPIKGYSGLSSSGASVWMCPAYKRFLGAISGPFSISYAYNDGGSAGSWGLLAPYGANGVLKPVHDTDVQKPSEMIGIGDSPCESNGTAILRSTYFSFTFQVILSINANARGLPQNHQAVRLMQLRHDGQWMTGFCDGHVAGLRPKTYGILMITGFCSVGMLTTNRTKMDCPV